MIGLGRFVCVAAGCTARVWGWSGPVIGARVVRAEQRALVVVAVFVELVCGGCDGGLQSSQAEREGDDRDEQRESAGCEQDERR